MKNYYQTLGLNPNCTQGEIKIAYREYAKRFHPDRQNDTSFFAERFREIKEAYDVLVNESERYKHDLYHGFAVRENERNLTVDEYIELIYSLGQNENYELALETTIKAIELFPSVGELYMLKGHANGSLGNNTEAIKCYKEALNLGEPSAQEFIDKVNNIIEQNIVQESVKDTDNEKAKSWELAIIWILVVAVVAGIFLAWGKQLYETLKSGNVISIVIGLIIFIWVVIAFVHFLKEIKDDVL